MNGEQSPPLSQGPQSVADWRQYLHAALAAFRKDPTDREAAHEAQRALLKINAINVGATETEANQRPSPWAAVPLTALHAAGLGTGEVLSGINTALQGKGFREGAQDYRSGLENLETTAPALTTLAAEPLGGALVPGANVARGVTGTVKAGVPLGVRGALALVGRGAVNAAVPGAVAGFSAGGDDPGDVGARLGGAARQGLISAALGAAGAGAGARLARRNVEGAAKLTTDAVQRARATEGLLQDRIQTALLKRRLADVHGSPAALTDIGDAIDAYHAGKLSEADLTEALTGAAGEPVTAKPRPAVSSAADAGPAAMHSPDPLDLATFKRSGAPLPGPSGGPIARALGMQARPGHPIYSGEAAPTRSAEVRQGVALLPSAKPEMAPSVNTGAADAYLRAGNLSQLERFDPAELAARAQALPGIGPVQRARIASYLSQKLGPELPAQLPQVEDQDVGADEEQDEALDDQRQVPGQLRREDVRAEARAPRRGSVQQAAEEQRR